MPHLLDFDIYFKHFEDVSGCSLDKGKLGFGVLYVQKHVSIMLKQLFMIQFPAWKFF